MGPKHTFIGEDVIFDTNYPQDITIESGVTLAALGEGAIVGVSSVVTKDIPSFEIWAGNPVRFIRKRESSR